MLRGGEPVIEGTRIPAAEVAALVRDGVPRTGAAASIQGLVQRVAGYLLVGIVCFSHLV
ncbi:MULTISPECIES: DUF433 domain-containing protein [Streptomyces]|nr:MULTISPECIES: DUF433 domain-containing protein [Streptomyces]MCX5422522.1 DUF433 domain-containing protein [Streptomyces sp. NBC_00078]